MSQAEYRAQMARWLEENVQINLESATPGTAATLRQLATATRKGNKAAFAQLVKLLARVLVSLAGRLEPEDPADLISVLYLVVQGGASTLIEMQSGVRTIYRTEWRGRARESRKRSALKVLSPDYQPPPAPGDASSLLAKLPPDEAFFVLRRAEGCTLGEIAGELGISEEATKKRWQDISRRLQARLRDD